MDFSDLEPTSWYPGHMRQAERELRNKLNLVDVVVELVDARAPAASHNPGLREMAANRGHVLLLGKSDLAVRDSTRAWVTHWRDQGWTAAACQHRQRGLRQSLLKLLHRADDVSRQQRGVSTPRLRALRAVVVGQPNTGKSTLINAVHGRRAARTGPRPGVTRHQQWVKLGDDCELLDTPGIMPPRLDNAEDGLKQGILGLLREDLVGEELLVHYWFEQVSDVQAPRVCQRYGLPGLPGAANDLLAAVARQRGLLRGGGEPDLREAAIILLRDLRGGRLGPFTLETPPA